MKGISAYILDPKERAKLAAQFPPRFSKFIGHHVTYQFGASDKDPLPPTGDYEVVGYARVNADEGEDGLEALVVAIDGSTKRPDGSVYHITWSHGPSYRPKDSIELVNAGYEKIEPIKINMEPVFLPFP